MNFHRTSSARFFRFDIFDFRCKSKFNMGVWKWRNRALRWFRCRRAVSQCILCLPHQPKAKRTWLQNFSYIWIINPSDLDIYMAIGESLQMSLFTFFLIRIRRICGHIIIPTKFRSWKSWWTWAICAIFSSLQVILKKYQPLKTAKLLGSKTVN